MKPKSRIQVQKSSVSAPQKRTLSPHDEPEQPPAVGAIVAVLGALLLMPSANYHMFDGLPLSSLPEFFLFVLLIPLMLSRALRRHVHSLAKAWFIPPNALLAAGLLGIIAKVLLLSFGSYSGFLACYRPTFAPPADRRCEKSYENPFFRFGATRVDSQIHFNPVNWNLSFFNSLRFNIYPWIEGNILRDRLPFTARWRGSIYSPESGHALITYVGEGRVTIGSDSVTLPRQHTDFGNAEIAVPTGRHELIVEYTFDDGYRVGQGEVPGPYATLELTDDERRPLLAAPPPTLWRGAGLFVDLTLALVLIALVAGYIHWAIFKKEAWVLLSIFGPLFFYSSPHYWVVICLIFLVLVFRGVLDTTFTFFSLVYLSVFRVRLNLPDLGAVLYRNAGEDWLTYESHARTILETWSLEGGEQIFYYQPAHRYIKFLEHFLFGDGDALIAIFALACLNFALFWMFRELFRRELDTNQKVVFAAAGILLVMVANSEPVVELITVGASEYPTWIIFPLIIPMLYSPLSEKYWPLAMTLLGISFLTRPNQGPAVIVMFAVYFLITWRSNLRRALLAGTLLATILVLPSIHDLYYGGRVTAFVDTGNVAERPVLAPSMLSKLTSDSEARAVAKRQLSMVAGLHNTGSNVLGFALHALQVLWVAVIAGVFFLLPRTTRTMKLLLALIPIAYLGVHVIYQVDVYYPRHILIGHLAMGAFAIYAASTPRKVVSVREVKWKRNSAASRRKRRRKR